MVLIHVLVEISDTVLDLCSLLYPVLYDTEESQKSCYLVPNLISTSGSRTRSSWFHIPQMSKAAYKCSSTKAGYNQEFIYQIKYTRHMYNWRIYQNTRSPFALYRSETNYRVFRKKKRQTTPFHKLKKLFFPHKLKKLSAREADRFLSEFRTWRLLQLDMGWALFLQRSIRSGGYGDISCAIKLMVQSPCNPTKKSFKKF